MKKNQRWIGLICSAVTLLTTGCNQNNQGNVWDDNQTTTMSRYKNARALWNEEAIASEEPINPGHEAFIALNDEDLQTQFADGAIPQPQNSPGDPGSGLPGFDGFHTPSGLELALFKTLYFNTDDHILRDKEYLAIIEKVATYMKDHGDVYLFVSGFCDERGPEQYNLALGTRRANYVRTKLIEKGIDLDRIHTISYGKERPAIEGHSPEAWAKIGERNSKSTINRKVF